MYITHTISPTGGTNTALALKKAREESFAANRVRPGVPHIGIVMTDGRSNNRGATKDEASKLKKAGVKGEDLARFS